MGLSARRRVRILDTRRRLQTIPTLIGKTVGTAAQFYNELAPDGRELTPAEVAAAREQLIAVTLCLRSIHPDWDLIDFGAEEGQRRGRDADWRPAISVLRMIQRGLALALSENPARRHQAMPIEELRPFLAGVYQFLRDL